MEAARKKQEEENMEAARKKQEEENMEAAWKKQEDERKKESQMCVICRCSRCCYVVSMSN